MDNMLNIRLITDYRGQLYSSIRRSTVGLDLEAFIAELKKLGCYVIVSSFNSILKMNSIRDEWIVYQSSEDPGLGYKHFIENIVRCLEQAGANIVPSYNALLCHHNKAYQTMYLNGRKFESIIVPDAHVFGTFEDLLSNVNELKYPTVIKSADGCTSKGVFLANTERELINIAKKLSRTFY